MNTRWLQNIDIQQIVSSQQYPTEHDYLNAFIEFCRLNWDKGIFVYVLNLVNISITRFSVSFALTMHFFISVLRCLTSNNHQNVDCNMFSGYSVE